MLSARNSRPFLRAFALRPAWTINLKHVTGNQDSQPLISSFHQFSTSSRRYLRQMSTPEIRKEFTDFFVEKHGHFPAKSSSLIPHNDRSLLFTNAGMVQFKEYFRNPAISPFKQATSVQKCMRAGGKHNDLDNVGYTPRHHTFFEMLGNFSFGEYSKEKAIRMAWSFLTDVVQLPKDRLRVTVLSTDQETFDIWKNQEHIPEEKILRCGPEDNFWSMGDGAGPCGPCTEIFWDTQDDSLGEDRWLEIWNLVFMQYYRNDQGRLEDLPIVCVDTGMGLERLAAVVQSKENNFQTDAFVPIFNGLQKVMVQHGITADELSEKTLTPHHKIIADHLRAMCFLIADGVIPSNVGRGYVLRRIIRRALRSGNQLGFTKPFMTDLYPFLLESLGDSAYPELATRQDSIKSVIQHEEEIFMSTLSKGLALLEPVFKQQDLSSTKEIPPEVAFKLYDTYGFPLDLTVLIAQERGWKVDLAAVEALKTKQQEKGRSSWKNASSPAFTKTLAWKDEGIFPQFSGYDSHQLSDQPATVLAAQPAEDGSHDMILAIDPCPFYGFGGGQVPDTGRLRLANGSEWKVIDVFSPYERGIAIRVQPTDENSVEDDLQCLRKGFQISTFVDKSRRDGAAAHHSATHLLNAALRRVLGKPIMQAGSLVEPSRLRFDFTHGKPLTADQIREIETWINTVAVQRLAPEIKEYPLQEAIDMGSIAVFSEKYGELVRVVNFPEVSMELCGGTHVDDLSRIYPFKIISEGSVAAGTRRVEAIVGQSAVQYYIEQDNLVAKLNQDLKAYATTQKTKKNATETAVASSSLGVAAGGGLDQKVEKMKDLLQEWSKKYNQVVDMLVKTPSAKPPVVGLLQSQGGDGIQVKVHELDADVQDQEFYTKKANYIREQDPASVHILTWAGNILVTLDQSTHPKLHAGKVLKSVLDVVGGKGGGQPQLARGKVKDASSIEALHEMICRNGL
ncbi:hypothetical protein BGW41_004744 [Actinomortierella wolfii]|nr:hypothetical protein BGW41_004744 [Actinomortierella wolfii]